MPFSWNSRARRLRAALLPCLACAALAACDAPENLEFSDLSADEARFVTRFVQLERARAVALVDREAGVVLLDSLSAAWGDTSLALARAAIPVDAVRQARVFRLLERILLAEQDSLVEAPRPGRLAAPLPAPLPEAPAQAAPDDA
jgi:hypothetical protein